MHRPRSRLAFMLAVPALAAALPAIAPPSPAGPSPLAAQPTATTQQIDALAFKDLRYRMAGPFRGGRSSAVTGFPNNPDRWLMGTTGGGVWESDDNGVTWSNISDGFFGGSIGAVAVADSDPNVIYVGEGSACIRGNTSAGHGAWKSMDGGAPGPSSGCPRPGRSRASRCTRATTTWSTPQRSATRSGRTRSGASSARATGGDVGARAGAQRLDRRVRSGHGHDQPAHSVCGDVARGSGSRGRSSRARRKAASTRRPTLATPGPGWAADCPRGLWGRSA